MSASKKILVVESDVPLAGSIAGALQSRGLDVALARDAQSVVDVARAERPDGIVLCAELTGGSGFVVCNRLRKDPELRDVPVLLTSTDATEDTFEQHRRLKTRADGYLHKPFAIAELLRQLAAIAGLPQPDPEPGAEPRAAGDDDDLLAFDAAFDSISQAETSPPVELPISAEDADAAAALLADLPDVQERRAAVSPAVAAPSSTAAPVERPSDAVALPEMDALRADLEATRRELDAMRLERDAAVAARASLEQSLAAEQSRCRAAEERVQLDVVQRERVRAALAAAQALLGSGDAGRS